MGIEQSFFIHPIFVSVSLIAVAVFFIFRKLNPHSDLFALSLVVSGIALLLSAYISFCGEFEANSYDTLQSERAVSFYNGDSITCVNVNGVDIPFSFDRKISVDGIDVLTYYKDDGDTTGQAYVYLREHKDMFFNGSHIRRGGIIVCITNYKVHKYEMEAAINESITSKNKKLNKK